MVILQKQVLRLLQFSHVGMHRVLKEIAIMFGMRSLWLEILFTQSIALVVIFLKSDTLIFVGKNVRKLFFQKECLLSKFANLFFYYAYNGIVELKALWNFTDSVSIRDEHFCALFEIQNEKLLNDLICSYPGHYKVRTRDYTAFGDALKLL